MKDLFVPYEIALKLKELGFNEPCLASYINRDLSFVRELFGDVGLASFSTNHNPDYSTEITAPLFQQAFEWFRVVHNLHGDVKKHDKQWIDFLTAKKASVINLYMWTFCFENAVSGGSGMTYKECELACLTKLIELIEERQAASYLESKRALLDISPEGLWENGTWIG